MLAWATTRVIIAIFAFDNNNSIPPATEKQVAAADIEQGKGLLEKSDCMTCHRLDIKLNGSVLNDIAVKYSTNDSKYNYLAQKIIMVVAVYVNLWPCRHMLTCQLPM